MTVLEQINNQEIDNQISISELREAVKPNGFLDNADNLQAVGQLLNNAEMLDDTDKELVNSLKTTIDNEINTILERGTATEEDIMLINVRKELLGENDDRVQRLDEIINNGSRNNVEITQENQEIDITLILQELDNEIETALNSPLNNLQELGIDISLQNNRKGLGILWANILNNIKNLDDLGNITEENVNTYLNIPDNIPKENYRYIAENLKIILQKHLTIHPGWKPILQQGGGLASGISIESVVRGDAYEISLLTQIKNLQKKSLEQQVEIIVNRLPDNSDLLDLWLKSTINSNKFDQETVLINLFDKMPIELSDKFFQTCEKNSFINELKNNYALYRLNKNNSIKTDNDKYCFLDRENQNSFKKFYGKGIELSENITFDELYTQTSNFYENLEKIGIDSSIPIENIMKFIEIKNEKDRLNAELEKERNEEIRRNNNTPIMGNPEDIALGHVQMNNYTYSQYAKKMGENCLVVDEEYVKILLKSKKRPTGKIPAISGADYILDFSKGNDPKKIVRDSFGEKFNDQRDKFRYDLNNDRQAAFGTLTGMIGGIAGSAVAAIFTRNIWATSAGFTIGLRLGNGIGQELRNSGEFLYEQISGNTINDGNNGVQRFGQGFLRGVGALDQNYEYVGTAKFLSGLGFDYLSNVATFGLSQKFGGFLGAIEGIKFAGGALKFGMEELILENFLVDIPMNIIQSGFEAFTGIDNGGVTVGNTSMGNEHTITGEKPYEKGSLSDMLRAMKDAATQNLSIENLTQTAFNTILYGGLLEGGGAAIKKMRGYLPAGQVDDFTQKSAIAATMFAGLTEFMTENNIKFREDGKYIDTKTNLEITESDLRFTKLCEHLNNIRATQVGVIESFETIMETQQQMIADPENRTGLLFRLGLISTTNTPLNILKKKIELVEKKLREARSKGDSTKIAQLEKLLDIYTEAETKLEETTNEYENKEFTDRVNELKKLEKEARDRKDKNQAKQYHKQIIDLYIEKMKGIPIAPEEKSERKAFFESMTAYEIEAYAHIHQKAIFEKYSEKYHQVANVDDFREFIGGDVGISADKTHEAASFLGDTYFDYILETNRGKGNNTIKFLAGGPGSGKSSVSAFPESNNNSFAGVLDGTMKTYENAEKNIENALAMGYDVRVEFVYRDITESFINGVLKRTIGQNQSNGDFTGRTVPLSVFEGGHTGARNTALKLYEKYGPNIVKFFGGGEIDLEIGNGILKKAEGTNPGKGPSFVYEYDIEYIRQKIANDILDKEACKLAVEEAFMRGEISSSQRDDLLK